MSATNTFEEKSSSSVGVVATKIMDLLLPEEGLKLECGKFLKNIQIAYETYGELNEKKNNAILILHALSGDAHAAGKHSQDDRKSGWWDFMIGPGKAFDTNRYFVVCSNVLGGCKGSTGPSSVDPASGRVYGMDFPILTIADMVKAQKKFIDQLGIKRLLSLAGGSMGGMQALEWICRYPDFTKSAMIIASTSRLSPQAIAFHEVGRHAIMSDPKWNNGRYIESSERPETGLAIARMIAHITYLSEESMDSKFGRRLQDKKHYAFELTREFEVESYLHYQGKSFVQRFDANTYLYITKAMDYYDAAADWGNGSLEKACERIRAKVLITSFTSDWLFPSRQSKEMVKALRQNNKDVSYLEFESKAGHDSFLLPTGSFSRAVDGFLDNNYSAEEEE